MAKMTTGMRMLAMTKADGNGGNRKEDNRMEGSGGMQMGGYGQMGDMPEMRRRRDSRGRYVEGGNSAQSKYYPGGTPPYVDGNEMRGPRMYEESPLNGVDTQHQPYTHHSERDPLSTEEPGRANGQTARMGGEGYVNWNRMSMNGGSTSNRMQEGNITSMHDYERQRNGGHEKQRMIGFQQNDEDKEELRMNREKAEKWVGKMKNIQIRMPYEEVQRRAVNYGIPTEKIPEFYAAFNMMQSDYGMVAKEFGVSKVDFYAAMAKAWIDDEDAVENKTALYEMCIVKPH